MAMKDARAWVSQRWKGRGTRVRFEFARLHLDPARLLFLFSSLSRSGSSAWERGRSITCSDPPRARISRHGRRRHPVPPFLLLLRLRLLRFQWERKAAVSASGKKRLTSITAAASTKKNTVDTTGAVDRYTFK